MSLSGSFLRSQAASGYQEDYFSMDDILATQEKVPCVLTTDVLNMGYVNNSNESDDLKAGTKVDFPFWLVKAIAFHAGIRDSLVVTERPKSYRESYRQILQADAQVVDLQKLGPYYYVFGCQLLKLPPETPYADRPHTDYAEISRCLLQAFQTRFRKIMDNSQNAYNEDVTKLTCRLDENEKRLFTWGQKGLKDFQEWQTRGIEKINASSLVMNHRKRKRAAMETR